MADNNTQWGGMIKGAVKIAAMVAVGVGIISGVGLGFEALGDGAAAGSTLETVTKFGAGIIAAVSGATETVASLVTTPFNYVVDLFSGSDPATLTGKAAVEAIPADASLATNAEALFESAKASVTESISPLLDSSGDLNITQKLGLDIATLMQEMQSLGLQDNGGLAALNESFPALSEALGAVQNATTPDAMKEAGAALIDTWNNINQQTQGFAGAIADAKQQLLTDPNNPALQAVVDNANALLARPELTQIGETVASVREELAGLLGENALPRAAEAWAAAGAGVVGATAAYQAGKAGGAREVMGKFTAQLAAERERAEQFLQGRV